jgi:hypothetical protein
MQNRCAGRGEARGPVSGVTNIRSFQIFPTSHGGNSSFPQINTILRKVRLGRLTLAIVGHRVTCRPQCWSTHKRLALVVSCDPKDTVVNKLALLCSVLSMPMRTRSLVLLDDVPTAVDSHDDGSSGTNITYVVPF